MSRQHRCIYIYINVDDDDDDHDGANDGYGLLILQVLILQQATFHDLHILVMLLLSCWLLQRSIPVCTGSC